MNKDLFICFNNNNNNNNKNNNNNNNNNNNKIAVKGQFLFMKVFFIILLRILKTCKYNKAYF